MKAAWPKASIPATPKMTFRPIKASAVERHIRGQGRRPAGDQPHERRDPKHQRNGGNQQVLSRHALTLPPNLTCRLCQIATAIKGQRK